MLWAERCCGQGMLRAGGMLWLPETGAVYGEFAGLGDPLFLLVAIVTDTIIKLSLNLAEQMDLSEAIPAARVSLLPLRCPPCGRPGRGDGASRRRLRILLTGTVLSQGAGQAAAPRWEPLAPAQPLRAGSTAGHVRGQQKRPESSH